MATFDYYKFCLNTYQKEYKRCLASLRKEFKGKTISEKLEDDWDKESQKSAIRVCVIVGLRQIDHPDVEELWNSIYRVHLYKKSGIHNLETIQKVISADQSWKKSSGHAFEEMIKELATLSLHGTNIEIILQRDLNTLIKAEELDNEPRDISWLKEQIKGNIFDLYAIVNINGKKQCFGCVQAKTSIRDRVTRDREPSLHAMQSFFWSVVFVLDGDFLKLPKFKAMVNGGTDEFPSNGWHGMYVLSAKDEIDRIYPITIDFDTFRAHALQALEQWQKRRHWFNPDWKAE